MHRNLHTFCIAAAMAAFAPLAAAADPAKPAGDHAHHAGHSEGSMELHRIMHKGMKMPMSAMSGDVDKDFARLMTMHHQQAIEMNAVLLRHGKDPELRELARKMTAQQKKEIAQMAPRAK